MKITVVATGFDDASYGVGGGRKRAEQRRSKVEEEEGKSELDVPAFIRKKIKS